MEQYDERDTLFSRLFELKEGTGRYKDYYSCNSSLEEKDRKLRKDTAGLYRQDILLQSLVDSTFRFLKDIRPLAHSNNKLESKVTVDEEEITAFIKKLAMDYGAVITGVTEMKTELYYSHRGRGTSYGEKVTESSSYAIVYAVEMRKEELLEAPGTKESAEVVRGYSRVALIGMIISYFIQNMGYDAKCHMDGETTLPMVPVAYNAGLGEVGRMGILINKDYGARLRLGVVTTSIPMVVDSPKPFGLTKICRTCRRCSSRCPANAIDHSKDEPWTETNDIRCYSIWKQYGTDCGICLTSCPFSK